MAQLLEFTYSDGMVRIKDVQTPSFAAALDFKAPPGDFYTMLTSGQSMTVYHISGRQLCSFTHSEVQVPSAGSMALLAPLIDQILTQSTTTSMTPKNIVFASAGYGSPTGNGSIADPLDTIAAAVALAEANNTSDSEPWIVHVLPGSYNEQVAPTIGNLGIRLLTGVSLVYDGGGGIGAPTFDDSNAGINLHIESGATVGNDGSGAVFSCALNSMYITGSGSIFMGGAFPAIEVQGSGDLIIDGVTILNTDGGGVPYPCVLQTGGTVRIGRTTITSIDPTTPPIDKQGGSMKLTDLAIYTAAPAYSSAYPESIQTVNCVSNVASDALTTETVMPVTVDAAFLP